MDEKTGWQTDEAARRYKNVNSWMIPGRADVYNIVAELTSEYLTENGRILDLGSGYGDVTEAVLQNSPGISALLVDYSDEMVRVSQQRFANNQKIKIMKYDLNQGLPSGLQSESFNAVVSCFATHHIEYARREPLYSGVHSVLKPGGIFINGDRFSEESSKINDWMFDIWVKWMTKSARDRGIVRTYEQIRTHQLEIDRDFGDKPDSLWAMEKDMRSAGFSSVDCLYKNQIIAVIAAVK